MRFPLLLIVMMLVSGWSGAALCELPLIDTPVKAAEAQKQWAAKLGKPVQWTNSVGMTFQLIPPGTFVMGLTDGSEDAPQRRVTISAPFYMATTEVARKHWEKVTGIKRSEYFPGEDQPINYITYYDAEAFLRGINKLESLEKDAAYRMPTEAQWEYAARAGSTTNYPGGDGIEHLDAAGFFIGNSDNRNQPVGRKAANAFGLHDMHGNVWEWCSDWYDASYYTYGPAIDPTGPELTMSGYRAMRGGSARHGANASRSGNRAFYQSSRSEAHIGFRVVLPIVVATEGEAR